MTTNDRHRIAECLGGYLHGETESLVIIALDIEDGEPFSAIVYEKGDSDYRYLPGRPIAELLRKDCTSGQFKNMLNQFLK